MAEKKLRLPVMTVDTTGMNLYDVGIEKAYLELFRTFAAASGPIQPETVGVIGATPLDMTCLEDPLHIENMGAQPLYLSCAFVIEEGFSLAKVEAYAAAMEKTANEAGVRIVAGDTKVAGKGQVDNLFITTTGIGRVMKLFLDGCFAKRYPI